jgi:hypothetical protein
MKDWKMIFKSSNLSLANMAVGLLNENEVPAKLLNKKDSAYVFLGEAEVYVPNDYVQIAKQVLATIQLDILDV